MNLKVVVKVMNFHSLLRVEAARKQADKYLRLEDEIENMIKMILLNRNFVLDKKTFRPNPKNPELNIYMGSDYGFCGSINSNINGVVISEEDRITIGKKLRKNEATELLRLDREEFSKKYDQIEEIINDSIDSLRHSKINLIYNHYYNVSNIELCKKCIFPFEFDKTNSNEGKEDFVIEGNADTLLSNLVKSYINYEIKIAAVNSFASENIIRQNVTSESLKKIEEFEQEQILNDRKERTQKEFKKIIESYTKKKGMCRL